MGGITATLGVIFPSLVIITVIAAFLQNFLEYRYVTYAFNGIRICVCVLIFDAVTKLLKKAVIDIPTAIIFAAVFLISMFASLPVVILVVLSGIVGVCVKTAKKHTDKGGHE